MGSYKDLTNKRFGRLIAKYPLSERKNGRLVWHCQCDCGGEKDIMSSQLLSGKTQSCGCLQKEKTRQANWYKTDLVGQKFHLLTVIGRNSNNSKWICRCDCGNVTEVSTSHLIGTSTPTYSCGCWQKKRTSETCSENLLNRKYGLLTVIGLDTELSRPKHRVWKCRCECGKTVSVSRSNLQSGDTQSCGCSRLSHGELKIKKILENYNIPFEMEKTFESCVNPQTGRKLRFDFYVNNQYLIEYDGIQHFKVRKNLNLDELKYTQYKDELKNIWCQNNKIPLIRIPYTKYDSLCIDDLLISKTAN